MSSLLKKWSIDLVFLCVRCVSGVKRLVFFFGKTFFRIVYWFLKKTLRRPLIALYRINLKIQSRYERLGVPIKNVFFYVASSRGLAYLSLACIAALIIHNNSVLRQTPPDILNPDNILSRVIRQADDLIVEEGTLPGSDSVAYAPVSGVKPVPFAEDLSPTEEKDFESRSSIAFNPSALLKPTIPTTQKRVTEPTSLRVYTVQPGDTIGRIAQQFGLKIQTILDANDLSFLSTLRIGQHLTILPRDGIMYRVKRGDTLAGIALTFASSVNKIVASNTSISSERIAVGQQIFIPDGVAPRSSSPSRQDRTLIGQLKNLLSPKGIKRAIQPTIARVGSLLWPTTARRITQYFSWHHPGVDIAGPSSNRIIAVSDGIVSYSGWLRGYGNCVMIDHKDGKKTRYAHASRLLVKKGSYVKRGETIAMVGSTGRSTGPHLHFELYVGNRRVNPLTLIR